MTNFLYNASLIEKLIAVVGKYLITLARFPLQKAFNPSSFRTLEKQSAIPLYYLPSRPLCVCYTYKSNLTLSMGAQEVLAIAPATPPIIKSYTNYQPV